MFASFRVIPTARWGTGAGESRGPALVAFRERAACEAAITALDGRFAMSGAEVPLKVAFWSQEGDDYAGERPGPRAGPTVSLK
jgi:hypothetical protein